MVFFHGVEGGGECLLLLALSPCKNSSNYFWTGNLYMSICLWHILGLRGYQMMTKSYL